MAFTLPRDLGGLDGIISRYDAAVARRQMWSSLYRECYRYAIPSRQLFIDYSPGQEKENELFDSTAVDGVLEFASRMQATICPPWRRWSTLEPGPNLPRDVRESDQVLEDLDEQTEILFSHLNYSNFTLKSHEAFIDLAVGTGAICCDLNDARDGLVFDCVPIARLAIEESPYGMVETVFEDKKLSIRSMKRLYGGKLTLPDAWTREKEHVEKSFAQGVLFEPKSKTYHLVLFAKEPKALLYHANLEQSSPYIVFRWSVVPGEVFGRGPVVNALADIRTLNLVVEYMLRGAALTLAPPLTGVSDGILNPYTAVIAPDTIIPVGSNETANPSLKPLLAQMRPDLAQFILEDMRQGVRRKLLADPRRREGPIESATEVLVEDREFVQQTGSNFGRIQAEFIERVIARAVYLLQRIGAMAPIKVDGRQVTLKHTSPLARAQDTEDLQNFSNFAALSQQAAGPEMYQLAVKTDEVPAWLAKKGGIPAVLIRSKEERDEKVAQIRTELQNAMPPPAGAPAPPGAPPPA